MTNFQRPLGGSFNSRPAELPVTKSETAPETTPAEGAPNQGGYQGHRARPEDVPRSAGRQDLAAPFSKFSKILAADLERDRKEREAVVAGALGLDPEMEKARTNLARIASLVQSGEMTEERGRQMWSNLHPTLRPEDVK